MTAISIPFAHKSTQLGRLCDSDEIDAELAAQARNLLEFKRLTDAGRLDLDAKIIGHAELRSELIELGEKPGI